MSATDGAAPIAEPHECTGCKKVVPTNLTCPTCKKLGIDDVYFCGQECFKANWNEHKKVHILRRDPDDDPHLRRFKNFKFTGELRPFPITPMRKVPDHIPKPDYALLGYSPQEESSKREFKIDIMTPDKIERLRKTCRLAREALDLAHRMIAPGVTCEQIDEAVHNFIVSHNAYPSPLNYYKFPKSCCTSVNEVICHGIPDFRPLVEGDIVNVDITTYFEGMHGDINETYFVGEVDDDAKRLVKGAYHCLMEAVKMCKPGVFYRDLGDRIQSIATKYNLSVVSTYCGHGIHEMFHCDPSIPHYAHNKAKGKMKPGHVFTIEPMINLGTPKDVTWPDDWTSVTKDGKRSSQFEHTLLVTESGVEILTARLPDSPPHDFEVPEGFE